MELYRAPHRALMDQGRCSNRRRPTFALSHAQTIQLRHGTRLGCQLIAAFVVAYRIAVRLFLANQDVGTI